MERIQFRLFKAKMCILPFAGHLPFGHPHSERKLHWFAFLLSCQLVENHFALVYYTRKIDSTKSCFKQSSPCCLYLWVSKLKSWYQYFNSVGTRSTYNSVTLEQRLIADLNYSWSDQLQALTIRTKGGIHNKGFGLIVFFLDFCLYIVTVKENLPFHATHWVRWQFLGI